MKKLILIAAIALAPVAASANIRTFTYIGPDGQMVICTETTIGSFVTVQCN